MYRSHLSAACGLLVLALAPVGTAAQSIPGPSFEEMLSLRMVGAPAISPDGRSIAFTVRATNWRDNRYENEIWLAREGEEPFQLTRSARGNTGTPEWSPDGRWIAFLADRGDRQQVHLLRAGGGEAQQITQLPEGVGGFRWAPDGRSMALAVQDPETDEMRRRKERFGEFAVVDAESRRSHIWLLDVAPDRWSAPSAAPCPLSRASAGDTAQAAVSAGVCANAPEPRRLTEGDAFTVSSFAWSPDGESLAFEHRADSRINSGPSADISIVRVSSGEIRPLVTTPGSDGSPLWSPDGRWILYYSTEGDTTANFYANNALLRVPASGGPATRLAGDLDERISSVTWTRSGIYFLASQGTKRHLYSVDEQSGRSRRVAAEPDNIFAVDFSADGRSLALLGQSPESLPEIYRTPVARYRPAPVTAMTSQVAQWGLGSAETVSWRSTDGTVIEGVLHKPRDYDLSRRYPLMVVIHGGPTGVDYPAPVVGGVYPINQWLAKGALVLRPNYRGSAGYGAAFRALNVRNLGVGDAWDVLSGVDHLIQLGIVDSTRMAAMGWSQGGYISAFLTTTSDRFKAISVGAGISNWMTYYVNTDITPFTRQYLQATPWDDAEIYALTSPMTYIRQARTPTLIQHGEFDLRVPIANAYELYRGLSDVGVESRLIVYKGFGHGINRPKEQLAALWHNWEWFARHLWGEDASLPIASGPRP